MEKVSGKIVEKITIHTRTSCKKPFFPESLAVYKIITKNTAERDRSYVEHCMAQKRIDFLKG
jgi:hypothetical protein